MNHQPDRQDDGPPSGQGTGQVANAISSSVVRLFAQWVGRGPTRARTVLSGNLVTVVLEDTLTKAERRLVEMGRSEMVVDTRRTFQQMMRGDLVRSVEEFTGREVVAFLSDQSAEPDYAVESFILSPKATDAAADDTR
jgi:uncharacterized protein YbcI